MTDTLSELILSVLECVPGATSDLIQDDLMAVYGGPIDPAQVQAELIALDDAGRLLMRNGWYRLSAMERGRRA